MAGFQISDAKAPWVMFERRAEEDREATIQAGAYRTKDVDYALITPHGSKDQFEAEVNDWFFRQEQAVREGRLDPQWLKAYKAAYENWKSGKEIPLEGTPIINWPVISPSQVVTLQALRILTVEALAAANEETIARLGMGGRSLVQKAKDFLAQIEGPGKMAEEMAALRILNESQKATIENLEQQVRALRAQLDGRAPEPAPEDGEGGISGDDLGLNDTTASTSGFKSL